MAIATCYSIQMVKRILGALFRRVPAPFRRLGVRLTQARFTVTIGAVVINRDDDILLLRHVFRVGGDWGIPGGFLEKGEQPAEAIRRELREEVGLELETAEIAFAQTLQRAGRVEIIFNCTPRGDVTRQNLEIKGAGWFPKDALPKNLGRSQRRIIDRALKEKTATS